MSFLLEVASGLSEYEVAFEIWRPPSGEIGTTSLLVIEKRPISPKPLQIGVSFFLTTNRKSLVGFQNMGSDLKFGAPSGEIGMTSLPVIETCSIIPKPLQIGASFLLTTNRKSIVGFQNMRSDLKFGAP